jgi:hypothetical protein
MTELFLDTEFTGLQQNTTLISLALVSKNLDCSFYAEFVDYDKEQLNQWLKDNVLEGLVLPDALVYDPSSTNRNAHVKTMGNKEYIAKSLKKWLKQFEKVTIWADVLAYDWVLFCELFGGAFELPMNINPYPLDLVTLLALNGIDPDKSRKDFLVEHAPAGGYQLLHTPAFQILTGLTPEKLHHNALFDACVGMLCLQILQKDEIKLKTK